MAETAVRIPRPMPGPVQIMPPEPVPHEVPRMAQTRVVVPPKVWRPMPAEMDDMLSWLVPRLQEKHTALDVDRVVHWLRGEMNNRFSLLVRTTMMVGLFQIVQSPMEPAPDVAEVFVRSRAPNNEEAVLLYKFALDWAQSVSAREFFGNKDSDAAMLHVQPAMNSLQKGYEVKKKSLFCVKIKSR